MLPAKISLNGLNEETSIQMNGNIANALTAMIEA